MYIYNVTINIEESVHNEFLTWIKQHATEMLATKHFTDAKMTQVLIKEEMGGVTYSIQFSAPTREDLDAYYQNHQAALQQKALQKFADKMLLFRTELKLVQEFKL